MGPQLHFTEDQRLDRNWGDLLQELRVTQTGVQLLAGFLLTLPFQQRFATLRPWQQDVYLVDVGLAIAATVLLVAPVLMHRLLFREHQRPRIVGFAHRCATWGGSLFGAAIIGVVYLVFDVTRGEVAAAGGAGCAALFVLSLWLAPGIVHREIEPPSSACPGASQGRTPDQQTHVHQAAGG